jgi:hypothetical protein
MQMRGFDTIVHKVDLCVVGGGMAGLIAAVTAARHGAQVLLMQDRPVLGGNASSEVRMWICGAHGTDAKETGLLEEIMLANYYRNSSMKYAIWDTVLYETARYQPGLTLLLNCACHEVHAEGDPQGASGHLAWVKGWQTTTQTFHEVHATYFADCSGDSVLRASGAEFRWGRESRHEFNESHAPEEADQRTMGNTILIETREHPEPTPPFIPPAWAYKFKEEDITANQRPLGPTGENFWWLEVGGMGNTIAQAEELRDELLRIAYGVWDLIKNHPDGRAQNWELEWIGALSGKRENIRYVGDHTLTQGEILAGGQFDDLVAYGGWTMDDHHPGGLWYRGPATVFHETPSPYGIPYRSLYSQNIDNLFFAGRNISTTHMAMSSTRVMATCSLCGQAIGTAAALAVKYACTPREVAQSHIRELQDTLMDDDAYLPWRTCAIPDLTRAAGLSASNGLEGGDPAALRSGIDRVLGGQDNGWWGANHASVTYRFASPVQLSQARLTFDSNQADKKRMPCWYPKEGNQRLMPPMLPKTFALEAQQADGSWQRLQLVENNRARLVRLPLQLEACAVRLALLEAWGGELNHVMAFEVA